MHNTGQADPISEAYLYQFPPALVEQGRTLIRDDKSRTLSPKGLEIYLLSIQTWLNTHADLFERQALGHDGVLVYNSLDVDHAQTKREIVQTTCLSASVVSRRLKRLKQLDLVHHENGQYRSNSISPSKLLTIIQELGVAGRSEKRRLAHQSQQAQYAVECIIEWRQTLDEKNFNRR